MYHFCFNEIRAFCEEKFQIKSLYLDNIALDHFLSLMYALVCTAYNFKQLAPIGRYLSCYILLGQHSLKYENKFKK